MDERGLCKIEISRDELQVLVRAGFGVEMGWEDDDGCLIARVRGIRQCESVDQMKVDWFRHRSIESVFSDAHTVANGERDRKVKSELSAGVAAFLEPRIGWIMRLYIPLDNICIGQPAVRQYHLLQGILYILYLITQPDFSIKSSYFP